VPDVWVNKCFDINDPPMCIDDVRYINELSKINDVGGVNVLVWRPGFENDDPNGSEAEIRPIVDWFRNLSGFEGSTELLFSSLMPGDLASIPYGADKIDYFIRNEGTVQELYDKLDVNLIPYLQKKFNNEK
jgi:hypothetical protein